MLARDELPLVEAQAVVQQHLDVDGYQPPAVAVDGVLELVADFPQRVDDQLAFAFRKVQRLVHLVREEGVLLHVAGQRRAADEVGVEDQRPPLGLELFAVVLHADDLSRCQTDERPLLIVVVVAAVEQVAALHLLEKDGVEAEGLPLVADG